MRDLLTMGEFLKIEDASDGLASSPALGLKSFLAISPTFPSFLETLISGILLESIKTSTSSSNAFTKSPDPSAAAQSLKSPGASDDSNSTCQFQTA